MALKDVPFVAYSPELDILSCGKTEDEAKKMLREAISLTLAETEKDGTTENFLEKTAGSFPTKPATI